MARRMPLFLAGASCIFWLAGLYATFFYAPVIESNMAYSQKIFYFHMPMGITSFLAFFVTFVSSILFLWKRERIYDVYACISAEVGLFFGLLLMAMGISWDRAAWGVWWTWDPRLTTFLILTLMYFAYFVIRSSVEEVEKKARFAAVFAIVAFINVPISFFAIRIFRTIHPVLFTTKGTGMEPSMLVTLALAMVAAFLLMGALILMRVQMEEVKEEVEALKDKLGEA